VVKQRPMVPFGALELVAPGVNEAWVLPGFFPGDLNFFNSWRPYRVGSKALVGVRL